MHPTSDRLTHAHSGDLGDVRLGVVGAGRVGTALAAALRGAGVPVEGPAGRGEVPRGCDAIVLCVPDAEIPAAAATVAGAAPIVGHTSGATPLTVLEAAGGQAPPRLDSLPCPSGVFRSSATARNLANHAARIA